MSDLSVTSAEGFAPCPQPFNMARHVLARGGQTPDKTALIIAGADAGDDVLWSYGDLIAAVRGTATGLLARGLSPGDIVLMRLANDVDFPIVYLAALAAGLVPVPTSAALTQGEVAKIIAQLRPALVVRSDKVPCPDGVAVLPAQALRPMRHLPPADWHMGAADRLGYLVYTSGTSGQPMAVMHAHRAIWARQMMFDGWYGLRTDDVLLHAGAFNWTYTLGTGLMDPWTIGATAVIPATGLPATALPELLARHGATIFAAAPGVYRQMLRGDALPAVPHLRHGLSAGEKMADGVMQDWQAATGTPVFEAFGMSECSTFISGAPERPAATGALGCAQAGRRVAILGAKGPVPRGTAGTIAVHRDDPGLMLGYWEAPERTRDKFNGDWFVTGDQAVMDAAGQITYLGRDDDMINAGGFRVSPLEVEAAFAGFPDLTGIAAVEVAVKTDVAVIAAFYTSPAPLDETALQAYAQDKLARYKQPRLYIHVDALPLGGNGKLRRSALRARFEKERK